MNKKIEQNRALLKRSSLFRMRESYAKNLKNEGLQINQATKEQLQAVREKVIHDRKVEFQRSIKLIILSVVGGGVITSILVYWILLW